LPPPLLRLGATAPSPLPVSDASHCVHTCQCALSSAATSRKRRSTIDRCRTDLRTGRASWPCHRPPRSSEMWHTFSRTCCHRRLFSIAAKQHAGTRSSVSITLHALQCCVARAVHSPVGKVFIRLVYFVTTPLFIAVSHTSTSYQVIL